MRLLALIYLLAHSPTGRRLMAALVQEPITPFGEPIHRTAAQMARMVEQDLINVDLRHRIRDIIQKEYFSEKQLNQTRGPGR